MATISTYPKNAFFLGVANVKIHKSELVWNLMIDDTFVLNKPILTNLKRAPI